MNLSDFEWDDAKDATNQKKHGIAFMEAQRTFFDPMRVIVRDAAHSLEEERFYCFGVVDGGVMTVRFTMRGEKIRIIGAGYWRDGKKRYEKENHLHG